MREREINHIATGMSPQPRGKLLTHGHGDEELDGEVDEEVQPGVKTEAGSSHGAVAAAAALGEAAAAVAAAAPRRRRRLPLAATVAALGGGGCPW